MAKIIELKEDRGGLFTSSRLFMITDLERVNLRDITLIFEANNGQRYSSDDSFIKTNLIKRDTYNFMFDPGYIKKGEYEVRVYNKKNKTFNDVALAVRSFESKDKRIVITNDGSRTLFIKK